MAATLYPLGESKPEPIHVLLDPDASIGQLQAQLKEQLPDLEFRRYVEQGHIVLLAANLLEGHPQSWALTDAYTKFMLTGNVVRTLQLGTALEFNLVLLPWSSISSASLIGTGRRL